MNADTISQQSLAGAKRSLEEISVPKRLRSKIPRRKRVPLLPIVAGISNSVVDSHLEEVSSSRCLLSEVTSNRCLGFARSEVMKRPRSSRSVKVKKPFSELSTGDEFRRITRSYAKKQERHRSEEKTEKESRGGSLLSRSLAVQAKGSEVEVRESNAVSEVQISEVSEITREFTAQNSEGITASNDAVENFPQVSESSCLNSTSESKSTKTSKSITDQSSSLTISVRNESARSNRACDLVCSEHLSDADDECSEYSTCKEMTLSEIESDLFSGISPGDSSYSSLSPFFESSGDCSNRSGDNSPPSVAFYLFNQLKQFVKSSGCAAKVKPKPMQIDSSQEFAVNIRRFEEEDEESYTNIRSRERREVTLHSFGEKYSSATRHGDRVLQQRLVMVNWMVEVRNVIGPRSLFFFSMTASRILSFSPCIIVALELALVLTVHRFQMKI